LYGPVTFAVISAGILVQSIGARNRVGIGLPYPAARLHWLAKSIPWKSLNILPQMSSLRVILFSSYACRALRERLFRHRIIGRDLNCTSLIHLSVSSFLSAVLFFCMLLFRSPSLCLPPLASVFSCLCLLLMCPCFSFVCLLCVCFFLARLLLHVFYFSLPPLLSASLLSPYSAIS
jgi:hypothetical protein